MPGDDLADDFVQDDDVLIEDNDEDVAEDALFSADEEERRSSHSGTSQPTQTDDAAALDKKRKRREKDKQRRQKRAKLAESKDPAPLLESFPAQSSQMLEDYLAAAQAKAFPKMSPIELMDVRIPATSIADTTSWTGQRTLDQLSNFILEVLPSLRKRLEQRSKTNAAPTLLFLTSAALRVADVTRVLKSSQLQGDKGGEVAKLFAKHIKISEQVTYLKRTKVGAAAGTPGRVGKLLCETDALSTSALSHIILDVSYKDPKNRSLLDIPETREEVFKLVLGCEKVMQAIKKGQVQLVLF
ncbi:U3-containing 90S pre-ribosomal complex subunit-domain containing protein [Pterulicium gracile]|uniref:U3-containing 90S pre-ribosomal complex subunit-domain containing protein n=1 Tax=Pterulicium gracile TaxID=1884261 RepID=A0A5C3QYB6_9AGAR|nr:U3-containing 90S pre-ribosomal complex subunit-domain containing protein [Pterula gracilis]